MIDEELRDGLAEMLDGLPPREASGAVERLIGNYRGRTPTEAPVLRHRADAVAYAAYRMPATFGAVTAALRAFAERTGDWSPARHVDVGGGTGAAVWAAAEVWAKPRETTVLDWSEPALALGRELASTAREDTLRAVDWQRGRITSGLSLPAADLVTVSYVLGELTGSDRQSMVDAAAGAAGAGGAVVIVEPGTPDGYLRVLEARDRLIEAGFRVLAPCPHSGTCPLIPGEDWCHFAARVNRSSLHRQVKGGSLPYEDEKYSYVAAVRTGPQSPAPAPARVVRKPQLRKGQVLLELCDPQGAPRRATVTKRQGPLYRAARNVSWGDSWPPPGQEEDPETPAER